MKKIVYCLLCNHRWAVIAKAQTDLSSCQCPACKSTLSAEYSDGSEPDDEEAGEEWKKK